MTTTFQVYAMILSGEEWVGYACRREKNQVELYPTIDLLGEELQETTLDELLTLDKTIAQLQDLPPMTQAWRWEPGEAFQRGRLPTGPTYFFSGEVRPGPDHPEKETVGGAFVNAWIRIESESEARTLFEQELVNSGMIVEQTEEPVIHSREDYEDDEPNLEYFKQAQQDGEVFVYHTSPRYPVYWFTLAVERKASSETAEAHYFLCGEAILQEGDDLYDPDFWTDDYRRLALEAAHEVISEADWVVVSVLEERPCGRDDLPEELVSYYDEAEEAQECLVFAT